MHAPIGCGASPGVPARGLAAAEAGCAPIRTTWHPGPGGTGRDGAWGAWGARAAPTQSEAWGKRDRAVVCAWNHLTAPPNQTGGLQEMLLAVWGFRRHSLYLRLPVDNGLKPFSARRDSE